MVNKKARPNLDLARISDFFLPGHTRRVGSELAQVPKRRLDIDREDNGRTSTLHPCPRCGV